MRAGEPRERRHERQPPAQSQAPEVGNLRPLPEQPQRPRPVHRRPRRIDPAVERIGRPLPARAQATVGSGPAPAGGSASPATASTNAPVPKVIFASPGPRHPCPRERRLLVHHARRQPPARRSPQAPPVVGAIAGSASTGTPNSAHNSASHVQAANGMSEVRDAVVGSVSHRPVSRCRNHASVVPSLSRPAPRQRRRLRHMRHDPPHLRGREIRIERQPRPLQRQRLRALRPQPLRHVGGPLVLPDDHRRHRLAPSPHPRRGSFPPGCRCPRPPPPARRKTRLDVGQQLQRIVLHPPRARIDLPVRQRGQHPRRPLLAHLHGPRARRPLIDRENRPPSPTSASPDGQRQQQPPLRQRRQAPPRHLMPAARSRTSRPVAPPPAPATGRAQAPPRPRSAAAATQATPPARATPARRLRQRPPQRPRHRPRRPRAPPPSTTPPSRPGAARSPPRRPRRPRSARTRPPPAPRRLIERQVALPHQHRLRPEPPRDHQPRPPPAPRPRSAPPAPPAPAPRWRRFTPSRSGIPNTHGNSSAPCRAVIRSRGSTIATGLIPAWRQVSTAENATSSDPRITGRRNGRIPAPIHDALQRPRRHHAPGLRPAHKPPRPRRLPHPGRQKHQSRRDLPRARLGGHRHAAPPAEAPSP